MKKLFMTFAAAAMMVTVTATTAKAKDTAPPIPAAAQKMDQKTTDGFEMVLVKGGTYTMGCTAEQGSDCMGAEKPAHTVTVSGFYIGKYEVTQ
jgi:formylglycine-generating enzyme required for sulfatase activity